MSQESIHVRRLPIQLVPDPRRTITRFFWPGEERAKKIIQRVKQLPPEKITELLHGILEEFGPVNPGLEEILTDHYEMVLEETGLEYEKRRDVRLLIGAYFSKEYAFESAALFNPSMVAADDQSNVPEGSLAFLMSLRAVGEGHISSITFRRGIISEKGDIKISPVTLQVRAFKRERNRWFKKDVFKNGIEELTNKHPLAEMVLSKLPDTFTLVMLEQIIHGCPQKSMDAETFERICGLFMMIAESEYEMHSDQFLNLEDMVMFPISRTESQGMEDMRLVLFEDDDGTRCYYGTYTAYNGQEIMPQLLEVSLPGHARVHIMRGEFAKNKGIAFFPQRIDGQYAVIGRVDSENIFLMKSDWEFVQMGN
ncbi:MAG: glycosidase, partial [Phycisphaerae bacterium]